MSDERPATCSVCGAPEVWCTCPPCGKPAEYIILSPDAPLEPTYSCEEHLGLMSSESDHIHTGDIPVGATCCFIRTVKGSGNE